MKKRIISIFLSIFIAVSAGCSAQQTAETVAATSEITTTAVSTAMSKETVAETTTEKATSETTTTTESTTAETEELTTTTVASTTTTTEATTTTVTTTEAIAATTTEVATTTKSTQAATTTSKAKTTTTAVTTTETTTTTEETKMTENEQTEKKVVALTFDDGPNTTTTNEVLDVLEKYGITASFFLIGNNINDESAKSVKRAYDMGCEIGNHSKTHSDMTKMSEEEILAEIEYTNEKVIEITGEAPAFFRPPYIAVNQTMIDCIEMPFISGYGANDWVEKYTAEHRAKLVLRQVKDGAIILLHDSQGNSQTVAALDLIIPELQAQGYEFVTISEVFERKDKNPQAHDGRIYSFAEQVGEYS